MRGVCLFHALFDGFRRMDTEYVAFSLWLSNCTAAAPVFWVSFGFASLCFGSVRVARA